MGSIVKYISLENINLSLQSKTRQNVIKEMFDKIKDNELIIDKNKCYLDLLKREEIGSTAVTDLIAIPHTKTEYIKDILISLGISNQGIDYGEEKVKLVILLLAPKNKSLDYLKLLGKFSRILSNGAVVNKIINCNDKETILSCINQEELNVKK